jgi:lipopolysaccharide heptosyltransferase II
MLPIGDTLFVEPTVRALRARYPEAQLVALTGGSAAPVWRCMPAMDEVMVLPLGADWVSPGKLLRTLMEVHARRFEVAVDFTSPAYKWISFLGGIPRRTYMKFDRFWWLLPRRHDRWRATHATQHYYDCALELDLPPWDSVDHVPRLELPAHAYSAAAAFLRWRGVDRARPVIGIHPGGAGLSGLKRWPAAAFALTADCLHDQTGAQIMLLGGPDERDLANQVFDQMRSSAIDAVGRVPLLASFALVSACDLFVGNDSSLLHAAAALGTPYVGVLGPTAPDSFHPVPRRPDLGRLVEPEPSCPEARAFVGSSLIWDYPRCADTCAALATLQPDRVIAAALNQLPASATRLSQLARH